MSTSKETKIPNATGPEVRGTKIDPARERELLTRVSRIRIGLTVWVPFFGHLLLKLRPVVSENIPTAAVTRDRTLLLGPDFCEKLTDSELAGVMCHEVLHLATLYFERMGPRTVLVMDQHGNIAPLWNIAADYAVNLIIEDMAKDAKVKTNGEKSISLPAGGLLDQKWREHSSEEIYDAILEEACENSKSNEGGRVRMDMPDGAWGQNDCKDGTGSDPDKEGGQEGQGEGPSGTSLKESENYWKQSLIEASQVHQQRMGQGTLPWGLKILIDEILNPKVSWIEVLSRWVGENGLRLDFSYSRPHRRSESVGEMLPTPIKHGVDDVCLLWDTSGSMHGREKEILGEVSGICDDMNLSVRLICCDAAIHTDTHDVKSAIEVLEQELVKGGGGSDFTPAFDKLEQDGFTGVVLVFTDGYIGVPAVKPECIRDVLWVLWKTDADPTNGSWGEVLRVDDEGNAS